ncbi:MAG: hypothetical protein ACTSV1_06655 [Alphaproteobacteria bacterium]
MAKEDRWRNKQALDGTVREVQAAKPRPRARPSWPDGLGDAYDALSASETMLGPPHIQTGAELAKWRILHKVIHADPFDADVSLSRGDQWRQVHAHIDETLGDADILDWVSEQAEINDNRDKGHPDMRPRKSCACRTLVLEYVGNRKRTALAIHHFALAEKDD